MKENFIEYYPNGNPKHIISYYENGNISYEQFYDKDGRDHREDNLPDFQSWYENGGLNQKTYYRHGGYYNINGPADIYFEENGKLDFKSYYLYNWQVDKLDWQKQIKNI